MRRLEVLVVLGALSASAAGCAFKGNNNPGDDGDDAPSIDADPTAPDGAVTPDAPPGPPDAELPAVQTTFGERTGSEHTGVTTDTFLDSLNPAVVFNSDETILVDGFSQDATGMLRFDLAAIPGGATIQAAELRLFTTGSSTGGGGAAVAIHVVLQPWTAAATWTSAGEQAWAAAGAAPPSRDAAAIATIPASTSSTEYAVELPTAVIQTWVDDPSRNLGVALVHDAVDGTRFRSSESPLDANRPQLVILYAP